MNILMNRLDKWQPASDKLGSPLAMDGLKGFLRFCFFVFFFFSRAAFPPAITLSGHRLHPLHVPLALLGWASPAIYFCAHFSPTGFRIAGWAHHLSLNNFMCTPELPFVSTNSYISLLSHCFSLKHLLAGIHPICIHEGREISERVFPVQCLQNWIYAILNWLYWGSSSEQTNFPGSFMKRC